MPDTTDSYTGDVRTGGPPDVRALDALMITKVSVGPMDNNAYLLECRATGELLLVDAADEAPVLLDLIDDRSLSFVVTTHRHRDHWQALDEIVSRTGARTFAGRADVDGIPVPTDEPLDDGGTISVGDVSLEVITLVGHTPGSVALLYRDPGTRFHLFTGDALFPGGPGKTTTTEDFDSLMTDLETKIFGRLPDDTWFYPGHGSDSTLGVERPSLPQWRSRGW